MKKIKTIKINFGVLFDFGMVFGGEFFSRFFKVSILNVRKNRNVIKSNNKKNR